MGFELPPIVKLAERLLGDIEEAAQNFARKHKYTFGSELRMHAFKVSSLALRAWRNQERRAIWIKHLVWAVDDLKMAMQLGKRLKAFSSFGQFEVLARTARELGRQVGGWHRQYQQLHPKGQNATPSMAPQRAQILSTRAASCEANP